MRIPMLLKILKCEWTESLQLLVSFHFFSCLNLPVSFSIQHLWVFVRFICRSYGLNFQFCKSQTIWPCFFSRKDDVLSMDRTWVS
jgi:hypothetical protein